MASDLLFSIMFADDTSVFIEGTSYDYVIDLLNVELQKVSVWLKANKLTVNIQKTFYMVFHRVRLKNAKKTVIIQDTKIQSQKNTKFLGIIIDDQLKWNDHITYVKNKISKSIGILYKARNYLNKYTLKNLYYTYTYPYLIYCVEVWGNACNTYLDPLFKLQKKCIRTISFSDKQDHTTPLFKQLDILCFSKLVIHRIALMMFKHSLDILPQPMNDLFLKNDHIHNHDTRQRDNLRLVIGKGEIMYKTFSFHGIHIRNHLNMHISIDVSYPCYKKLSKKYIQNNDIVYRIR